MFSSAINAMVPPLILDTLRRLDNRVLRFEEREPDWAKATAASTGYDTLDIVERVALATKAVIAGAARYERDSVLFHDECHAYPLLASLLRIAIRNSLTLDIVDFGGALGTTYRRYKGFVGTAIRTTWQIVEQPSFVEAGRREFTTAELSFWNSLVELPPSATPRCLLASSSMQFLPVPMAPIEDATRIGISHLILDRTPMSEYDEDILCIQHVPRHIYRASYPCWVLSRKKLMTALEADWNLIAEFDALDGRHKTSRGIPFRFCGMTFERKT